MPWSLPLRRLDGWRSVWNVPDGPKNPAHDPKDAARFGHQPEISRRKYNDNEKHLQI